MANQLHTRSGLARQLEELADSGFTGSVEINAAGVQGGRVYLSAGRMYWAEMAEPVPADAIVTRLPLAQPDVARVRAHVTAGLTIAQALEQCDGVDMVAVARGIRVMAYWACRQLLSLEDAVVEPRPGLVAAIGAIDPWPVSQTILVVSALPEPAETQRSIELAPCLTESPIAIDHEEWRIIAALAQPDTVGGLAEKIGMPATYIETIVRRMRARGLALLPPGQQVPDVRPVASAAPTERATSRPPAESWDRDSRRGPSHLAPSTEAAPVHGDRRASALRRLMSAVRRI